jgi:hypothetical protein
MYGLIGKMLTVEGTRDELLDILLKATGRMPAATATSSPRTSPT